jgi:CHAT domain-containing protein
LCANNIHFEENNFEKNPALSDYYDANVMLNSLLLKAQAFEKLYQTSSLRNKHLFLALESLEKADSLTDKVRQSLRAKGDQLALSARVREVHEDAVRIALTLSKVHIRSKYYLEKAFYFAEKSKSAALLSAVSDSEAKSFADISPELLAEEKTLKDSIAFFEQKLAEKPAESEEKLFRNVLFSFNQKYQNFILNLEKNYSEYYRLKYDVKTANAADVRENLPEDALLLSYFIAEKTNRIIVFCLSKSGIFVEDKPQAENFKQLFVGLRNAIKFKSDNLFKECAFTLNEQLIPHNIPSKTRQLIFIPDGILSSIPFECLLRKDLKNNELDYKNLPYLIRDFSVNYAFSATLFLQNLKKMRPKTAEKSIFVCAPVRFNNNKLGDLPATETEAEVICQKFEGENLRLTFDNAHESKIKSGLLKNFAYLHFATHGTVDEKNPELSKIFLAQTASESQEDGCLFTGEIYNLSLNADLVTLSACETGLGKQMKGEGIIGLSRAFLYAGAKNLIVSLWSVADESTANFMIDFYEKTTQKNVKTGFSENLQAAKINMIQHEKFSAPYYWAAFVLIGN